MIMVMYCISVACEGIQLWLYLNFTNIRMYLFSKEVFLITNEQSLPVAINSVIKIILISSSLCLLFDVIRGPCPVKLMSDRASC